MLPIIRAKHQYLNQIYSMILELAKYEHILDKIKINEIQLGNLLFCDRPNHFVGIAVLNEKLCGLVMFNYTKNNICVNVTPGIYIENLYVSPEFRNQGIGRALLNFVAREATANDCSRIEWWVSRHNQKANNFYNKMGAIALSDWNIFKCDQKGINLLNNMGSNR